MAWNVNKCINWLVSHSNASSQHQCAKYVREAIEAGGLSTAGRPVSACKYKSFLPTIGFNLIKTIRGSYAQRVWSNTNAQPGDISVMDHGEHGHICMWSGNQWISDFRQNNMWPYGGEGTCYIFRYNGEIDGSIDPVSFGTGLKYTVPRRQQNDNKLITSISSYKKQLLLEAIGLMYDLDCPDDDCEAEYRNLLTHDESTISESIVELGMFWPSSKQTSLSLANEVLEETTSDYKISNELLDLISLSITGKKFRQELSYSDLNGLYIGNINHKTYGYLLSKVPQSDTWIDEKYKTLTRDQIESMFISRVAKCVEMANNFEKTNNLSLTKSQKDGISLALYTLEEEFFSSNVASMIKKNPNDPKIYNAWVSLTTNSYISSSWLRQQEAKIYMKK